MIDNLPNLCPPSIYFKKIWVNGCFDILHRGHIELFNFAKRQAKSSHLVVGVDTDSRVKSLKGDARPKNNLEDRMFVLNSLKAVDETVSFGTDQELEEAIKNFSPDYMVVGSDYKDARVIGSQYAEQLIFFERIKDYSTSKLLDSD